MNDLELLDILQTKEKTKLNIAYDTVTENLHVDIILPGFSKDDIDIITEEDLIIVSGYTEYIENTLMYTRRDFSQNDFSQKIRIKPKYIGGDISASFDNGVLKLVVKPKDGFTKIVEIN